MTLQGPSSAQLNAFALFGNIPEALRESSRGNSNGYAVPSATGATSGAPPRGPVGNVGIPAASSFPSNPFGYPMPSQESYAEALLGWSDQFGANTAKPARTFSAGSDAMDFPLSTTGATATDPTAITLSLDFNSLAMRSLDGSMTLPPSTTASPLAYLPELNRRASTGLLTSWPPSTSTVPSQPIPAPKVASDLVQEPTSMQALANSTFMYDPVLGFIPVHAGQTLSDSTLWMTSIGSTADSTLSDVADPSARVRFPSYESTSSNTSIPSPRHHRKHSVPSLDGPIARPRTPKENPTRATGGGRSSSTSPTSYEISTATETIPPKLLASTALSLFDKEVHQLTPKEREVCVQSILTRRARNTASARRSRIKRLEEMEEMDQTMQMLQEENQRLKAQVEELQRRLAELGM